MFALVARAAGPSLLDEAARLEAGTRRAHVSGSRSSDRHVTLAEDGQSFAGTYTVEMPAGMAEAMGVPVGQLGPGEVTGQRIVVEPMGTPVGPLPQEGGPAQSPTPEASPAG